MPSVTPITATERRSRALLSGQAGDRLSVAIERDIAAPGPYFHGYVPEDGKGQFHGNCKIWRNDQPYWPITGFRVASFWFSPDPVNAETGVLEFVRGSHKWDRWFQPEYFGA